MFLLSKQALNPYLGQSELLVGSVVLAVRGAERTLFAITSRISVQSRWRVMETVS